MAASLTTILLFFIYTWGIGFGATYLLFRRSNFFERNIMRIGIGLGVIPILGSLLNLLRIPIDYKIFLVLSLIGPAIFLIKNGLEIPKPALRLTKSNIYIFIVIILFLATSFMYMKGAFGYPYLEDDDPWHHAQSVSYVAKEKIAYEGEINTLSFLDPYPPGYAIMMGILHQTSSSVSWTLKFFNALIISLGILFFYFFVQKFTQNQNIALYSTIVLAMIPSYLSHFIWAHALIVTLFFPAMYCLEKIGKNRNWIVPGSLVIAGILVTQPSQNIKLGVMMFAYFLIKSAYYKRAQWTVLGAQLIGVILSFSWWHNKYQSFFSGTVTSMQAHTTADVSSSFITRILGSIGKALPPDSGTATRAYTFNDFFIAKSQNLINNPIGWGIVISLLAIMAIILLFVHHKKLLHKENYWKTTLLIWFLFAFLGTNSMTFNLPIGLFAFRFWMLLAFVVSILAGLGINYTLSIGKSLGIPKLILIGVIVISLFGTAGLQKYHVNTANWPPGATWTSQDEILAYLWLKTLPDDTKVFAFTSARSDYLMGLDKFMCIWCPDEVAFQKRAFNESAASLNQWLKSRNYQYLAIGGKEVQEYGINKTNDMVNQLGASPLFNPVHQTQGAIIFQIV